MNNILLETKMKRHTTMIESMGRRLDHLKREKTQTDDKLPDLPYHTMKMNLYSRAEMESFVAKTLSRIYVSSSGMS